MVKKKNKTQQKKGAAKKPLEVIICPKCGEAISPKALSFSLVCPSCKTNLKHKRYLDFLEFLIIHGVVENLDFFDEKLYGDEFKKFESSEDDAEEEEYARIEEEFERIDTYDETSEDIEIQTAGQSGDECEFESWEVLEQAEDEDLSDEDEWESL